MPRVILDPLFHWSPTERRKDIQRDGLRPLMPPTMATLGALPYVCLSPTPARAWSLSGDIETADGEVDEWDLWEVRIGDRDSVRVRPDFGPEILEVKLFSPLPADRLWYVGSRVAPSIEELQGG